MMTNPSHNTQRTAAVAATQEEVAALLALGDCRLLGICGLGGSGKTTLANEAAAAYAGRAVVFQTDWYCAYTSAFRRAEVLSALDSGDKNKLGQWADPTTWYDWPRMLKDLEALKAGDRIEMADAWRQSTGERDLVIKLVRPSRNSVIIVDGIYLLHPSMRSRLDRVLFLETLPDSAHERTGARDGHRVDQRYLDFKRGIVDDFELPYFERFQSQISRTVPAQERDNY